MIVSLGSPVAEVRWIRPLPGGHYGRDQLPYKSSSAWPARAPQCRQERRHLDGGKRTVTANGPSDRTRRGVVAGALATTCPRHGGRVHFGSPSARRGAGAPGRPAGAAE